MDCSASLFDEADRRRQEAVDACEAHEFNADIGWSGMVRCEKCGWLVAHQDALLYLRGLQDGKRAMERRILGGVRPEV